MVGKIFISYAIKDRDVADDICGSLEDFGLKCWIAPRDVLPGSDWGEAIIDAISQSRLMVLVHSENANRSIQIKREVERATSKGIPIIPFRIEDVPVSKFLEYHLSTAHWLDAISPPLEPHFRYLSEVVSKIAEAPQPNGSAMQMGSCTECGAAMPPGVKRCDACGHVREIPSVTGNMFPGTARRRKSRRRWPFRLRSRAAKISIIVACVVALALGIYFVTRKNDIEAYINQA
jgi:hypothetical protein